MHPRPWRASFGASRPRRHLLYSNASATGGLALRGISDVASVRFLISGDAVIH